MPEEIENGEGAERTSPKQPTAEEEQEREDFAYELLSRCLHKSQIKKEFIKRYEVKPRTVERYLSRARMRLAAAAQIGRDELRAESLSFYLSVLRDQTASHRDRLLARERVDRLFGLDTPIKIAPTSPDGNQPYASLSKPELIAELLAKLQSGGIASGTEDG